jgi:hypothetical protein
MWIILSILLTEEPATSPDPEFEASVRTFVTVMAVIALVMTWLWLYFRVKDRQRELLKIHEEDRPEEPATDAQEEAQDPEESPPDNDNR